MTELHTIDTDLKQLIVRGLHTYYGSISATHGVETGNNYQSVVLGDVETHGFREDRSDFLDRLDFTDKKVLDLGSNLGELSRAARARGACLVDGFETDPYFREVANLINVVTDTTRVSFHGRDIADPSSYDEGYDLVLAFSVFRYIRECLAEISERTNVLVLETHLLRGNFDSDYLEPVERYFPFWESLGESDWGRDHSGRTRAVVVFAREESDLVAALKGPPGKTHPSPLAAVPNILGSIGDLAFDGRTLQLQGWCAASDRSIDRVEVSTQANGEALERPIGLLAVSSVTPRTELDQSSKYSGAVDFAIDCECEAEWDDLVRYDVTALSSWVPIGQLGIYHLPGMFAERGLPPTALAERFGDTSNPRKRALNCLQWLRDMLRPVARYRELHSFESVLDWGCRLGALEVFVRQLLPEADVTGVDVDKEAIEWCRQAPSLSGTFRSIGKLPPTDLPRGFFDLVLGHSTLPRLTREGQTAWLAEINRVMKSGGYAALTVNGELLRPFLTDPAVEAELESKGISDLIAHDERRHPAELGTRPTTHQTKRFSIAECAKWFGVLLYVEGGANNQQDLLVLRKG